MLAGLTLTLQRQWDTEWTLTSRPARVQPPHLNCILCRYLWWQPYSGDKSSVNYFRQLGRRLNFLPESYWALNILARIISMLKGHFRVASFAPWHFLVGKSINFSIYVSFILYLSIWNSLSLPHSSLTSDSTLSVSLPQMQPSLFIINFCCCEYFKSKIEM